MGDVFCFVSVILTLVRLAKKEEGIFEKDKITAAGLEDCYEPVAKPTVEAPVAESCRVSSGTWLAGRGPS